MKREKCPRNQVSLSYGELVELIYVRPLPLQHTKTQQQLIVERLEQITGKGLGCRYRHLLSPGFAVALNGW